MVLKPKLSDYFILNNIPKSEPIGVDINKNIMYACSNGMNIYYRDTNRIEKNLANVNRKIQRDKNRYKNNQQDISNSALFRLNKRKSIYEHISNIHKDTAYKGALNIVRLNPEAVIIESLDIKAIMGHSYIADDLQFHPLGIAQKILEQQCIKYNIPVIKAPINFQSSNFCSVCGTYKDIKNYNYFVCPNCKARIQRDTNAAINLKKWYLNNKK